MILFKINMTDITKQVERRKAILGLLLLTVIFGLFGVLIRVLDNAGFTLLQQVYLRTAISLVTAYIIFKKHIDLSKLKKLETKEWVLFTIRAVCIYLLGIVLFSAAVINTNLGNAALISTLPIIPALGFIFFREKLTLGKVLATVGAFSGAFLIAATDVLDPFAWKTGDFYALISAVGLSVGYATRKLHSELLNNREITLVTFFFGLICVLFVSFITSESLPANINWTAGVIAALFITGFLNVINLFVANYAFEKLSNVLAGNILTLETLFSILFGYFIYSEILSVREALGGMMIILSVWAINKIESQPRKN